MADEVKDNNERECKDIFMLLVYLLFWVAFIVCMGIGFSKGNPDRLVEPMDFKGQLCGHDEAVKDCKYLAWMEADTTDILVAGSDKDLCVRACAGNTTNTPFDFSCYPDMDWSEYSGLMMPADNEVFGRCLPLEMSESANEHWQKIAGSDGMADLENSLEIVFLCAVLAVVLSFLWLELIKRFANEMIWATVFGVIALGLGFVIWVWKKVYDRRVNELTGVDSSDGYLAMAVVVTIIYVILLIAICVMRSKISMTGELLEEAGIAVRAMPLLVLFPVLPFIVMVLFFLLWGYAALYIASAGSVQGNERFEWDDTTRGMMGFHFFALIWNLLFIVAVQETTVAGAVATWYYTRDKTNLGSPIQTCLTATLKYNLGSIALGSLLVAIVKILSMIFELMRKVSQDSAEKGSGAGRFFAACFGCILGIFDRFISFITRNALIHVAIYNTSFCTGASESFRLIRENAHKVAAVNAVGDAFLFFCKFTVTLFSALICMVILDKHYPEVQQPAFPALVVAILAWTIGCQFFGTVEMAVDTILICFCHEEDIMQGNPEYKPYMSDDLKQFVERHQGLNVKVGDEAKS